MVFHAMQHRARVIAWPSQKTDMPREDEVIPHIVRPSPRSLEQSRRTPESPLASANKDLEGTNVALSMPSYMLWQEVVCWRLVLNGEAHRPLDRKIQVAGLVEEDQPTEAFRAGL
jgi:hypothetical protein